MNTTFILHGGKIFRESENNNSFFKRGIDLVDKDKVRIVACYWARDKDKWQEFFDLDKSRIAKLTQKEVEIVMVSSAEELFKELELSDILYIPGGDPDLIKPYVLGLTGLKEEILGKVYLGSSMGAFILCRNYLLTFDKEDSNIRKGLGILPFNLFCHWDVETSKIEKVDRLKLEEPETPILMIEEEKFISII